MAIFEFFREHILYALLTGSTFLSFLWLLKFRTQLRMHALVALVISILHTVVGLMCVKLFAFLEGSPGGQSLFGAVFFMPLIYFGCAKLFKRKTKDVFDVFTICMILALLFARVGCIISGCCLGKVIPGTDGIRWPTRELEVIFYLIVIVWLGRKTLLNFGSGLVYPYYMIDYGIFRFVIEWFRVSEKAIGYIHISHIWALVSLFIGLSISFEIYKNNKETRTRRRGSN